MRKCLLFVALLLLSQINKSSAQYLFESPDTVCIKQPIKLTSNVPGAASHYWGFCSGYLFDRPQGIKMGEDTLDLLGPSAVEIAKDGDNYFAFVANTISHDFVRLSFGNSLDNEPMVTNFGAFEDDFGTGLPQEINSMYVVQDEENGNWHIFVGGRDQLARIDFGKSFDSTPNIVNFGNLNGLVNDPRGIFVAEEEGKWYGFFLNYKSSNMVKMEFDTSISLTPTLTDLGCFPQQSHSCEFFFPTDMAPLKDNGTWMFYVTNEQNSYITFCFVGPSLAAANSTNIEVRQAGNLNNVSDKPSSIAVIKDCDSIHLFITNKPTDELIRLDLKTSEGFDKAAVNYSNVGSMLNPSSISRLIRDGDNIYALIANLSDSSLSKVVFRQCDDATITSSTTWRPPVYSYDTPGYYNVYYAVDEGLPTMQVQCRQIAALAHPAIILSNDTSICQGDTVSRTAFSINALNTTWSPSYNISNTTQPIVTMWPEYTETYRVLLPFANGCIIDTPVHIKVRKVKADAGPDRTLRDGAGTVLGGPRTSLGVQYAYQWVPNQYIDDPLSLNPVARPPYDLTYYLSVSDTSGCESIDTVNVHVQCNGINLPNAFVPGSINASSNRFGIANTNIIKLNHFIIYDRWGKQVFTTTDPTKQWDGNVNGEPAPMGVYVWAADGFCLSGERVNARGNVTLIR